MKKIIGILAASALGFLLLLGIVFYLVNNSNRDYAENRRGEAAQRALRATTPSKHEEPDSTLTSVPALPGLVVARPQFHYGKDDDQTTGTVFFLRDNQGQNYLVTAAHLYKDHEWASLRKIALSDMQNRKRSEITGKPFFIGKFTEDSEFEKALLPDMSEDLVFHRLPPDLPFKPLKIASQLPSKDELIWAIGCEIKSNKGQQLYPCKYLSSTDKMFMFKPVSRFDPEDFSGAPLVNKAGEVVGTLNAGNANFLMGTPLSAIRRHADRHSIKFE